MVYWSGVSFAGSEKVWGTLELVRANCLLCQLSLVNLTQLCCEFLVKKSQHS
ncbi:hypothetical protein VCRLGP107_270186 [Vibrio crassostreae]|nr:hypothetical protein VCRLGP107_270186 [Vibrio crassostreae]